MRLSPARLAILAVLCVAAFQYLIVQGYGGNWTVLFVAGSRYTPPPDLSGKMYQHPNSDGFDGQFYFYIARDFTNARNTSSYVDFPFLRWLRMLIPASAAALALENPEYVLVAYIAIIWSLCALGARWVSISFGGSARIARGLRDVRAPSQCACGGT
ncbi:MAG: hypothetical protein LC114_05090 [Bryobacterales bacterium]|nr:hypothetical protein [Bryobacterales bacterium]